MMGNILCCKKNTSEPTWYEIHKVSQDAVTIQDAEKDLIPTNESEERKKREEPNYAFKKEKGEVRSHAATDEDETEEKCSALFNYNPVNKDDEDLEFQKDDLLIVLKVIGNRLWAKHDGKNGKEGYVQKIFTDFGEAYSSPDEWGYFGKITFSESESMLKNLPKGTYLVRDCSSGGFSVDVNTVGGVKGHKISVTNPEEENQEFYIRNKEDKRYDTIFDLIDDCKVNRYLSTKLVVACKAKCDNQKKQQSNNDEGGHDNLAFDAEDSESSKKDNNQRNAIIKVDLAKLDYEECKFENENTPKGLDEDEDVGTAEALYNYNPKKKKEDDVVFEMDDIMDVLKIDGNRFLVTHKKTEQKGYVHKLYVSYSEDYQSYTQWWYFGNIDTDTASAILRNNQVQTPGTFLVRDSSGGGFAIYVLTGDADIPVKKHLIEMTPHDQEEQGFCIKDSKEIYETLDELIIACQDKKILSSVQLKKPCVNPILVKDKRACIEFVEDWPIGLGNFSKVHKAKWKEEEVAVKKLTLKTSKFSWQREVHLMMNLEHDNLLKCYGAYIEDNVFCIVLEWMGKGNLLQYFKKDSEGKAASIHRMMNIASKIVAGMVFLEEKKLIHRDLAARNVLVGSKDEIKIADFGLARALPDTGIYECTDTTFPVQWTSPEALEGTFSSKSDVWSYGIVLFEIFTRGGGPYPGMAKSEVRAKVTKGYRPRRPENTPDSIFEIMEQCWEEKRNDRPSFAALSDKFKQLMAEETKRNAMCEKSSTSPPEQEFEKESNPEPSSQEPKEITESVSD